MTKFDRSALPILIGLLASSPGPGFGYADQTHTNISKAAVRNTTTLSANLPFSDWAPITDAGGAGGPILNLQFKNSKGNTLLVSDLVAGAAVDEDNPPTRVVNHFFDPVNDKQLTDLLPLPLPPLNGVVYKSPDWAITGSGQNLYPRSFSYSDARQQMLLGLTSKSNDARNINIGLMFESLGHVIHHLQDMAQPQHVRNEGHLNIAFSNDPYSPLNLPTYSRYEAWAEFNADSLPIGGYSLSLLSKPQDYWSVRDLNSPNAYGGIADFTNANFVSPNRMFMPVNGRPAPDPVYHTPVPLTPGPPLDVASILQGPPFNCVPAMATNDARCSLKGTLNFVTTEVIDSLNPGANRLNRTAALWSVFNQDLQLSDSPFSNPSAGYYTVNPLTFPSAAQELIPRAVGYSAGLLDYFFRGKIDLAAHVLSDGTPDGTYDFTNLSAESIDGTIQLYYDAVDGNRYQATGADSSPWSVRVENVGPGEMRTQLPPIGGQSPVPARPGVYLVVFTGTMGSEKPIGTGPGAVVAKQVNMAIPKIYMSSLTTIYGSGGSGLILSLAMPPVPSQPGTYYFDSFFINISNYTATHVKLDGQDYPATSLADVTPQVGSCTPLNSGSLPSPPNVQPLTGAGWGWIYSTKNWTHWNQGNNMTGSADQFLDFNNREPNAYPNCATNLVLGLANPQASGVELLVGARSIFKFCIRLAPPGRAYGATIAQGDTAATAYISHMSGVGLMDKALGILPDPSPPASCPGL